MLTFHQAKGLEFDHIYVGNTGRNVSVHNALRTALFSGRPVTYTVANGQPETRDPHIIELATADREREVYVALTRAKHRLTILHDPTHPRLSALNPALEEIFESVVGHPHPLDATVLVKKYAAE